MVGVFTIVFAFAFLTLLRRTLIAEVDDSANEAVHDLSLEASQGLLPNLSAAPPDADSFVQVVNAAGRVTEGSSNVVGKPPIAWHPARPAAKRTMGSPVEGLDGDFRVAALSAPTPNGTVVVYVGRSLKHVNHDLFVAAVMLGVGLPLLVALVGSTTWFLVGRALEPVEIANARQRRFIDDASHELRSPLAVLRAELELALTHAETADWPGVASRMLGDVSRQERLVQDLLFMARTEHADSRRPATLVDLDAVVFDEVERIRIRSTIVIDTTGVSAAPVRGQSEDLARVVANLLDNAVRHATRRVCITLGVDGSYAELVVHDDGPGIPAGMRAQIFERFARIDEGRSRDRGGTGLGLAIASEIVTDHGGTISVADTPAGARLIVRVPAED